MFFITYVPPPLPPPPHLPRSVICLSPYTPEALPVTLACRHAFHAACVTEWAHSSNDCPLCRRPLALMLPSPQQPTAAQAQAQAQAQQGTGQLVLVPVTGGGGGGGGGGGSGGDKTEGVVAMAQFGTLVLAALGSGLVAATSLREPR